MTPDNEPSENPNNCATCGHKQWPEGGWCYMFRHEPSEVCMAHTARRDPPSLETMLNELEKPS